MASSSFARYAADGGPATAPARPAPERGYPVPMGSLPSGTVTFVFTDIAGSTRLLKRLGDAGYATALQLHRRLVRETFAGYDGHEIDTQGDAFFFSFVRARQAVAAAIDVQRAHAEAAWPQDAPLQVRIGLHTGEPVIGDEGYTGMDVVRAARIGAVGDAGQILISDTTRAIATGDLPDGVTLRELGERQLKDIDRPEPIWQLAVDDVQAEPAQPPPEEPRVAARSPLEELITRTRDRIQAQVMSELERTLPGGPGGGPPEPTEPSRRSTTKEIGRLHRLREDGALTEEQYRRAVDRLLASDGGSRG
jgi:class 3 adenylate cyclase